MRARPRVDADLYPEPVMNAITFWGHACSYIDVGGYGIVTDPFFGGRWTVLRRRLIPIPPPQAYDQTRLVLISHAHHDHLDAKTLARFSRSTVILAPEPAARYLRRHGIQAHIMRPGSRYDIPGGTIVAVPAFHPGGRFGILPHKDGNALGYVIRTDKMTIYYSGDTKYFSEFASVGATYRPDVALLNVNRHLHSEEALLAISDLGTPAVIPLHYGAYSGPSWRLEPKWRGELVRELGATIVPLQVGESLSLFDAQDTSSCAPR
jgi:L-ascorbate metabolism protein UlaG (beta-lactamase superfamily)